MFKLQAPQAIWPQLLPSARLELEHFLISQSEMRKRIEDAEGLNLTAFRFPSPLAKCIRLNLLECFHVFERPFPAASSTGRSCAPNPARLNLEICKAPGCKILLQ
jgi:hypothetical protein